MNARERDDLRMRSLAAAVARGRTVKAWATHKNYSLEGAQALAERPEFPALVEECRIAAVKRTSEKILRSAQKAIDALGERPPQDKKAAAEALNAATGLMEKWLELMASLDLMKKLDSLAERVRILEDGRAAHVRALLGNWEN
jgi:hypothetical protein